MNSKIRPLSRHLRVMPSLGLEHETYTSAGTLVAMLGSHQIVAWPTSVHGFDYCAQVLVGGVGVFLHAEDMVELFALIHHHVTTAGNPQ